MKHFNLIDEAQRGFSHNHVKSSSRGKVSFLSRLSIMNAAVQRARQQIMDQEDIEIFKALDSFFL